MTTGRPAEAKLLIDGGRWWAEDLPAWSHAVTSQVIEGRLYNVRVAFVKRDGFCTTLLSVFGRLGVNVPVSDSRRELPDTNTSSN